jgi:hypothetical protein
MRNHAVAVGTKQITLQCFLYQGFPASVVECIANTKLLVLRVAVMKIKHSYWVLTVTLLALTAHQLNQCSL